MVETNMEHKNLIILLFLSLLFSCSETTVSSNSVSNTNEKTPIGFHIVNGPRQGFMYADTIGPQYTYRYITSTIINNSTTQLHLEIDFTKAKNNSNDSFKSLVFLLPRHLTPDRQQFDQALSEELKRFLSKVRITQVSLDTILIPNQKCVMSFGILTDVKYAEPFGISLKALEVDSSMATLGLGFDGTLLPCGKISFIKH